MVTVEQRKSIGGVNALMDNPADIGLLYFKYKHCITAIF